MEVHQMPWKVSPFIQPLRLSYNDPTYIPGTCYIPAHFQTFVCYVVSPGWNALDSSPLYL